MCLLDLKASHLNKMKVFLLVVLLASAYARPSATDPEYGDLWQGDIELKQGESPLVSKFNAIVDKDLLWTDNTLYYIITEADYTQDQIDKIVAGADEVAANSNGCVQLVRVPEDNPGVDNYCYVEQYSGCSSYVGMIGGSQRISLVDSCVDRHGTIMHEFLHALGFHHEHMRADRDDYVTIHWENIEPAAYGNFVKLEEGVTVDHLGTSYDYGSVLHYSETAFAIDPTQNTITPHDPDAEIGQRTQMSETDSERVQILYGCLAAKDSKYFKNMSMEEIFAGGKLLSR